MRHARVIISCEHGGRRVPEEFRDLFAGRERLLLSHRGYDPGALELAQRLARIFGAPLIAETTTRLLIDMNRQLGRRTLFSELTRPLPEATRNALIARYLEPHQNRVQAEVRKVIDQGQFALHLAAHTFTPVMRGKRRRVDVALLYNPARPNERAFSALLKRCLRTSAPGFRVRFNNPYRGNMPGLCDWHRRQFPDRDYLGVEVELNQRFVRRGPDAWRRVMEKVIAGLINAIRQFRSD